MKTIDTYSYHCGTIDCFNEMLAAGLKHISLSHPQNSAQERDDYLAFSAEICKQYGTAYYVEDCVIATDLFPLSMTDGK